MRLIALIKSVGTTSLTPLGLIALTQGLPELDRIYIPIAKVGRRDNRKIVQSETQWPSLAVPIYGHELVQTLQKNAEDFFAWYSRCKRALILSDFINGVPMETIEQRFSVNAFSRIEYGHVQSMASTTRFHLRAAAQIAAVIFIDQAPADSVVETLLRRLEVGLPENALGLLNIPLFLARGEYLALYQGGIKSADELWKLSPKEVADLIGDQRGIQVEKHRPSQLLAKASISN
jgi:replicative superfamily II helicase